MGSNVSCDPITQTTSGDVLGCMWPMTCRGNECRQYVCNAASQASSKRPPSYQFLQLISWLQYSLRNVICSLPLNETGLQNNLRDSCETMKQCINNFQYFKNGHVTVDFIAFCNVMKFVRAVFVKDCFE